MDLPLVIALLFPDAIDDEEDATGGDGERGIPRDGNRPRASDHLPPSIAAWKSWADDEDSAYPDSASRVFADSLKSAIR